MAADKNPQKGAPGSGKQSAADNPPDWADGLKQLYDAVVEEPLSDSFKDLLAQFDDDAADGSSGMPGDDAPDCAGAS